MKIVMKDLRLQKLWLVHRGDMRFTMRLGIEALPVAELGALEQCKNFWGLPMKKRHMLS